MHWVIFDNCFLPWMVWPITFVHCFWLHISRDMCEKCWPAMIKVTSVTFHHCKFRGRVLLQSWILVGKSTKLSVITPVDTLALTCVYNSNWMSTFIALVVLCYLKLLNNFLEMTQDEEYFAQFECCTNIAQSTNYSLRLESWVISKKLFSHPPSCRHFRYLFSECKLPIDKI